MINISLTYGVIVRDNTIGDKLIYLPIMIVKINPSVISFVEKFGQHVFNIKSTQTFEANE